MKTAIVLMGVLMLLVSGTYPIAGIFCAIALYKASSKELEEPED